MTRAAWALAVAGIIFSAAGGTACAQQAPTQQAPTPQDGAQTQGSSSAPGQMPIDLVAAMKALDQTLVAQGFSLLPKGGIQIEPAFTYARYEVSFPSFLFSGPNFGTTTAANSELRQNLYTGDLAVRAGLPYGFQAEVDVPYRYIEQQTNVSVGLIGANVVSAGSGSGMSDVTVSVLKQLLKEGPWRPNLIAGVQYSANTGGTVNGFYLGNGYPIVRGLVSLVKSEDPLALTAAFGFGKGLPANGINWGNEFDSTLGAYLSASPETTLRFQLDQRFVSEATRDGVGLPGTGLTQASLVVGVSVIVAPHTLLDVSVGAGLTSDTPKYFLRISLPITFSVL